MIRLNKARSLTALDDFNAQVKDRFLPVTTSALRLAAELWASVRRQGIPTADLHALDVDVILAAQVLSEGLNPTDFVVATSNVSHIARFVPAAEWRTI